MKYDKEKLKRRITLLFNHMKYWNSFAVTTYINSDENYTYFKISNGYTTEVLNTKLLNADDLDLKYLAKEILRNY